MTESLTEFFIKSHDSGIHTLSRYISRHVAAHWQRVFNENFADLAASDAIDEAGYERYCKLLFEPVNQSLARAGYASSPPLPGNYPRSREWGPQDERQRWLWSRIAAPRGEILGTILIIFYHDHTRARIPRPPLVLPLEETGHGLALGDSMETSIEAAREEVLLEH